MTQMNLILNLTIISLNEKERLEAEGNNANTDIFNSVLSLEEI